MNEFKSNIINLESEEFEELIRIKDNAVIIDVRTKEEHDSIRIPNSVLLDIYKPNFTIEISKLNRDKNYFLYCRTGTRSYHAAAFMIQSGFKHVYNLEKGIVDWNGPTEQS